MASWALICTAFSHRYQLGWQLKGAVKSPPISNALRFESIWSCLITFLKIFMDCACRIIAHLIDINLHHKKNIPLPHPHVAWQDPIDHRHLCVDRFGEGVPLPDRNWHFEEKADCFHDGEA
jgi:hypothetical protein